MVPESLISAWKALPENRKAMITRQTAKRQPVVFETWVAAAGLTNFRQETMASRKAMTGPRLDKAMFAEGNDQLAMDILVSYFTELQPEMNERYFVLMENAGNEEAETQLKVYAQLLNEYRESPLIELYLRTALWAEEFAEEDFEVVQKIAKGNIE